MKKEILKRDKGEALFPSSGVTNPVDLHFFPVKRTKQMNTLKDQIFCHSMLLVHRSKQVLGLSCIIKPGHDGTYSVERM